MKNTLIDSLSNIFIDLSDTFIVSIYTIHIHIKFHQFVISRVVFNGFVSVGTA